MRDTQTPIRGIERAFICGAKHPRKLTCSKHNEPRPVFFRTIGRCTQTTHSGGGEGYYGDLAGTPYHARHCIFLTVRDGKVVGYREYVAQFSADS